MGEEVAVKISKRRERKRIDGGYDGETGLEKRVV